jgi:HEPN domain-containing protein
MAEKYLKAFLVYSIMDYPKIHQLDKLLELCAAEDDSFNEMQDDAILLNEYYVEMRYPVNIPSFSWKEADEAFKTAEKIKEFVLGKIKNADK